MLSIIVVRGLDYIILIIIFNISGENKMNFMQMVFESVNTSFF